MEFSNKKGKAGRLFSIWLCFVLIPLNISGEFVAKVTGLQPIIFNGIACSVYIILTATLIRKIKAEKLMLLFFLANCCLIIEHILMFGDFSSEFKQLLYILVFIFVACSPAITENTYRYFKEIILIFSIFMFFDALIKSGTVISLGYRMFNIRNYTIIDKTGYTELFPLAIIILFNGILKEKSKKRKIVYGMWIAALAYVILFLFESKTGFIAACIAIFVELFIIQKKYRKKLAKIVLTIFVAFAVYIIFIPHEVPDYILALLSFLGVSTSSVNAVYYQTYDYRLEILRNVLRIFVSHPFFGIGFGNYYNYASDNNMLSLTVDVQDVESSFLALFAEGGLTYFFLNCFIWVRLYMRIKRNTKSAPEVIGTFICMIILLMGNDYMNLFYWIWLGIYWRISKNGDILKMHEKDDRLSCNSQI